MKQLGILSFEKFNNPREKKLKRGKQSVPGAFARRAAEAEMNWTVNQHDKANVYTVGLCEKIHTSRPDGSEAVVPTLPSSCSRRGILMAHRRAAAPRPFLLPRLNVLSLRLAKPFRSFLLLNETRRHLQYGYGQERINTGKANHSRCALKRPVSFFFIRAGNSLL